MRNAEHSGEFSSRELSRGVLQSDLGGSRPSQFVVLSFFSSMVKRLNQSALGNHIRSILSGRAKPKVVGIDTGRIVPTGTVVENQHGLRNWTTAEKPSGPMCSDALTGFVWSNLSVSIGVKRSSPNPTGFSLFDFGPESFWKVGGKSLRGKIISRNVLLHNKFVLLCRALGCYHTAEAFSLCQGI